MAWSRLTRAMSPLTPLRLVAVDGALGSGSSSVRNAGSPGYGERDHSIRTHFRLWRSPLG